MESSVTWAEMERLGGGSVVSGGERGLGERPQGADTASGSMSLSCQVLLK
jgi:hypothetical protein